MLPRQRPAPVTPRVRPRTNREGSPIVDAIAGINGRDGPPRSGNSFAGRSLIGGPKDRFSPPSPSPESPGSSPPDTGMGEDPAPRGPSEMDSPGVAVPRGGYTSEPLGPFSGNDLRYGGPMTSGEMSVSSPSGLKGAIEAARAGRLGSKASVSNRDTFGQGDLGDIASPYSRSVPGMDPALADRVAAFNADASSRRATARSVAEMAATMEANDPIANAISHAMGPTFSAEAYGSAEGKYSGRGHKPGKFANNPKDAFAYAGFPGVENYGFDKEADEGLFAGYDNDSIPTSSEQMSRAEMGMLRGGQMANKGAAAARGVRGLADLARSLSGMGNQGMAAAGLSGRSGGISSRGGPGDGGGGAGGNPGSGRSGAGSMSGPGGGSRGPGANTAGPPRGGQPSGPSRAGPSGPAAGPGNRGSTAPGGGQPSAPSEGHAARAGF